MLLYLCPIEGGGRKIPEGERPYTGSAQQTDGYILMTMVPLRVGMELQLRNMMVLIFAMAMVWKGQRPLIGLLYQVRSPRSECMTHPLKG